MKKLKCLRVHLQCPVNLWPLFWLWQPGYQWIPFVMVIIWTLRQQTQTLQNFVDQVQKSQPSLPQWGTPFQLFTPNVPCGIMGCISTPSYSCQRTVRKTISSPTLTWESHIWCMFGRNGQECFLSFWMLKFCTINLFYKFALYCFLIAHYFCAAFGMQYIFIFWK